MSKIWNHIRNNKAVTALNVSVLSILFVPYSFIRYGATETAQLTWHPNFVYSETETILPYLFILIFTIGFQLSFLSKARKILVCVNVIQCNIYSFLATFSILIPIQDYSPGPGQFIVVLIGPLTLIILGVMLLGSPKKLQV